MNDLSNAALRDAHFSICKPIPSVALYILIPLFFLGFSISIFVLIVVRNPFFFLFLLFLSILLFSFCLWNSLNWTSKGAIVSFLRSFPDSDLTLAREGQLVKITGFASCGTVSLESSYEKATGCIYASTTLYECRGISLMPQNTSQSYVGWRVVYTERFSTDFYITDRKTGVRALVRAGPGSKLVPLIIESKLVDTTRHCRILSPSFTKWLRERSLPTEPRKLRLEEGYVQEGSSVSVMGTLHWNNGLLMIVQPPDMLSTGCIWQKLLLPVDVDGLILGASQTAAPVINHGALNVQERLADI